MNNSVLSDDFENIFPGTSYYAVSDGLGILNKKNIKKIYNVYNMNYFSDILNRQNYIKNQVIEHCEDHSNFLKYIGGLK
jgi:hypothetical protein